MENMALFLFVCGLGAIRSWPQLQQTLPANSDSGPQVTQVRRVIEAMLTRGAGLAAALRWRLLTPPASRLVYGHGLTVLESWGGIGRQRSEGSGRGRSDRKHHPRSSGGLLAIHPRPDSTLSTFGIDTDDRGKPADKQIGYAAVSHHMSE